MTVLSEKGELSLSASRRVDEVVAVYQALCARLPDRPLACAHLTQAFFDRSDGVAHAIWSDPARA